MAPIVGVGGVVLAEGKVLLVQRGRAPLAGQWSLPGGRLELGETLAEGVRRELLEETGLRVRPLEVLATLDRIVRDVEGRIQFHYVLVDWLCVPENPEAVMNPVCGDDAYAACWVDYRDTEISAEVGIGSLDANARSIVELAVKRLEEIGG